MTKRLNARQKQFVREYLLDLNATGAARRAGYSEKTAYSIGFELLRKPEIQKAVQAAMERRAKKNEITADMIVRELAKIGFANLGDYLRRTSDGEPFVDLSNMTPEQSAALSEVTVEDFTDGRGPDAREVRRVKVKLCDKRAALVDLGKHIGMFRGDTGDDDAPMPVKVEINVIDGRKEP